MASFSGGGDSADMFGKVGMVIQDTVKFTPAQYKQLAIVSGLGGGVAWGMIQQRHFPEKRAALQLSQRLAGG